MIRIEKQPDEIVPQVIDFTPTLPDGQALTDVDASIKALDIAGNDVTASLIADFAVASPAVSMTILASEKGSYQITILVYTDPDGYRLQQDIALIVGGSRDLSTMAKVKNRAEVKTDTEDGEIQMLLSAFSLYVYRRTGRDALKSVEEFTEEYDGSGSSKMFLRNYPVLSISSVKVNGADAEISSGYGIPGIAIIEKGRGIGFVSGSGIGYFPEGIQNVQVVYRAGYYGVPEDLEAAVVEAVAIAVKRKQWLDLRSKSISVQGGAGTTSYRDWNIPPSVSSVLDAYTRWWSI